MSIADAIERNPMLLLIGVGAAGLAFYVWRKGSIGAAAGSLVKQGITAAGDAAVGATSAGLDVVSQAVGIPDTTQTVTDPDGTAIPFEIDPFKKRCLVEGLDDVALTLEHADAIAAFEARVAAEEPWRVPVVEA